MDHYWRDRDFRIRCLHWMMVFSTSFVSLFGGWYVAEGQNHFRPIKGSENTLCKRAHTNRTNRIFRFFNFDAGL